MSDQSRIRRRTLLKGMTATSLFPLLGANLIGCSDGSDDVLRSVPAQFLHGVASGDPLQDRVILWTRLSPESQPDASGAVGVAWEVSTDEGFTDIVASGSGATSADVDYTVKVDAQGLQPGQGYYYRFHSGDRSSPVGRTRTLPQGAVEAISFAVVSCSNYPAGFFNVYREVARQQELDAVLHLGDYIYEYSTTGYASQRAEEFGRLVQPANELLTLSDYRTRYAQYRGDVDLQAAHSAHPFIVIWDDHEVANNAWREGAENHNPGEGDYSARKLAAIQAWYEWLPVRPPSAIDEQIYRSFNFGDMLDLMMLDTRIIGRDEQYTYGDFFSGEAIDVPAARAAFGDANRTLLGEEQLDWLREQLSGSAARWQVLGQQVLMGRYHLPAPIMEALDPGLAGPDALAKGTAAVLAAVEAKGKAEEERSSDEVALLASAIPYNLDAWDGYEYERDELLRFARDNGANLVALAGDTHNAWNTQLTTPEGAVAGVEFGCASVSSPGLDSVLGEDAVAAFTPLISILMDDLRSADLSRRGYLHLRFTQGEVQASQRFVSAVDTLEYVPDTASIDLTVQHSDMLLS